MVYKFLLVLKVSDYYLDWGRILDTYLYPEPILHVEQSVFEGEYVHQVEHVHDAVVDDEPDVKVLICLIFTKYVSEGDNPGIIQHTRGHHCQPAWNKIKGDWNNIA